MKFLSALVLVGLVQASQTFTSNGVTYTVTMKDNGVEIPVKFGPTRNRYSRGPLRERGIKRGKRQNAQTSSNWCGIVDQSAPSGTWYNVQGGWTVPQISLRQGQSYSDEPSVTQWVGIDGDGCGNGLIQGGTVSQIESNGEQTNYAWFEFVPNPLSPFQMDVNTGDNMYGNVTATGENTGYVEVTNQSNGQSMSIHITDGPGNLCGYSAEWIFEDLTGGNGLLPFAEFPNNDFIDTQATTTTGQTVDASQGHPIDLAQNGQTLCTGSYSNGRVHIESGDA